MSRTIKKLGFILIPFIIFLVLVELLFLGLNFLRDRQDKREVTSSREYIMEDPALGYKPIPGIRVVSNLFFDGDKEYSVFYAFDNFGRRHDPEISERGRPGTVAFFGGSFTFGEGVFDHETIPGQVEQLAPSYKSYNFAFHGYGPQQMLAKLIDIRRPGAVQADDNFIGVYIFTDYHVRRAIGSMSVVTAWGALMPCFEDDGRGGLIRKGSFAEAHPLRQRLYGLLTHEQVMKFFKIDLPLVVRDRHVELNARMVEESQKLFAAKFGSDRFYAVIYPGSKYRDLMVGALEARGVKVLDYSGLFNADDPRYQVAPHDRHPSPLAHRLVAEKLVQDLELDQPLP